MALQSDVDILSQLDHPNVQRLGLEPLESQCE
jgi:hypothetical protein